MTGKLILMLLAATALSATARQLSPDEALQAVMPAAAHRAPGTETPQLAYTATDDATGAATVYVFNMPGGGFKVVAADSDVPQLLLGYSDSGSITSEPAPAFIATLDGYSEQISAQRVDPRPQPRRTPRSQREAIAPLCRSTWGQQTPYNLLCPYKDGQQTVTGCVATAMAQVMQFHKWPQTTGNGSVSYKWNGDTLSMDFSQTSFDWDNILDIYSPHNTMTQYNAVALLCKACGYAVKANYGPSTAAVSTETASALVNYFDYNPGIVVLPKNYFSPQEFEDSVYTDLLNYGPVLFSGHTSSSGHAFVIDGYEGDGYFHVNWGWDGNNNGYFLLDALNPLGNDGFNNSRVAILHVRPRRDTDVAAPPMIMSPSSFIVVTDTAPVNEAVQFRCSVSYTGEQMYHLKPALRLIDSEGFSHYTTTSSSITITSGAYLYNRTYSTILPDNLRDGEYSVSPVAIVVKADGTPTGQIAPILVSANHSDRATLTVSDGIASFSDDPSSIPEVTDISFNTDTLYAGAPVIVKGTLAYDVNGVYYGTLHGIIIDEGTEPDDTHNTFTALTGYEVEVFHNQPQQLEYSGTVKVKPGKYLFCFVTLDSKGAIDDYLSEKIPIVVDSLPACSVDYSQVSFNGFDPAADDNPVILPSDALVAYVTVECLEGTFYDNVDIQLLRSNDADEWVEVARVSSQPVKVEAGESRVVAVPIDYTGAIEGRVYAATVAPNNSRIQPPLSYFRTYHADVAPALALGDLTFADAVTDDYYGLPRVEPNNITITLDVSCIGGAVTDALTLTVVPVNASGAAPARVAAQARTFQSEPLNMVNGDSRPVTFRFAVPAGESTLYSASVDHSAAPEAPSALFMVDKGLTALDTMGADTEASATFYDLQGRPFDRPSNGFYIAKTSNGYTKILITK